MTDREERYRLLLELSQRIGSTFDLQEILGHLLASVRLAVEYDAAGVFVLSFLTADSSYGHVLVGMAVMGVGMGLTMTPMTDLIMGSVPKEKAGVGSAMNDTTRQIGGALGVAILGSLTAAHYHSAIDGASFMGRLPAEARSAVHDSIGGANFVATKIGPAAQPIITAANKAFVDAMSSTVLIAAVDLRLDADAVERLNQASA
jgi:MFS family permease